LNPPSQKFSKTDLAKYENSWMQLPWLVSMGAQKNFIHFSIGLAQNDRIEIDVPYFQSLVGKAILFKCAEKLIASKNFGGYRANIVTYTIAFLSFKSSRKIDLESIWRRQTIPESIQAAISEVSEKVHAMIINPPNGKNVTEWCKKKECWDSISGIPYGLSLDFKKSLIITGEIEK
jgi:hypothetical protein